MATALVVFESMFDNTGPLVGGELDRADRWGKELAVRSCTAGRVS
jgi:hypothetical protein